MKTIGIFNHVLGPVMRGPSSSHTAGAYHIACMARSILGSSPARAVFAFDPRGSYAATYAQQGADRGFAMGLMGKPLTDESFFTSLADAAGAGLEVVFEVRELAAADHPNTVEIALAGSSGKDLELTARSVGGGEVEITRIDGRETLFNGSAYEFLIEVPKEFIDKAVSVVGGDGLLIEAATVREAERTATVTAKRKAPMPRAARQNLEATCSAFCSWESTPVYFVAAGSPLFTDAAEMVQQATERALPLGRLALEYESQLLGQTPRSMMNEMLRRYDIMVDSVERGLDPGFSGLRLVRPCAASVFAAEAEGRLTMRSAHTRAAARAMAVMHVDGAMGVVCAAPTGGSAGVIPGTLVTLAEELRLTREQIALSLFAAGAIGVIVAQRATFAAEVAGCQVEIGASGAMAAAAVVDAIGGTAAQACDAAAIAFQNTMGSVCDLLHGTVEIPCHTRNAVAASAAFVNADLVLGGYHNPIPLDETIDAVFAVGKAMPSSLRCTSKGGLAVAPAALRMVPGRCGGCL